MKSWSCSHLSDEALLQSFAAAVARHRVSAAEILAALAEIDARRLYLRTHHHSLLAWCVGEMRFSEDAAKRRIRAARTARAFPAILPALADGRLSLSTVLALSHHLTPGNAAELLGASLGRTEAEVEQLLAERFPRPDLPPLVLASPLETPGPATAPTAAPAAGSPPPNVIATSEEGAVPPLVPADSAKTPASMVPLSTRGKVVLLSPGHYGIQFTFEREAYEQLRYALSLASHELGPNELAKLFALALKSFVRERERRRFAACVRAPRVVRDKGKSSENPRYVPAHVRREVWQRDGGRCTFVSEAGRRCESCERLEFDHVTAVARGGESTAANLRLRCRAHNQLAAEQAFGAAVVDGRRERARRRAAEAGLAKARAGERARAATLPAESQEPRDPSAARAAAAEVARRVEAAEAAERAREEVIAWLRALGVRLEEARRAVAASAAPHDAPLEVRVHAALRQLAPRGTKRVPAPADVTSPGGSERPAA